VIVLAVTIPSIILHEIAHGVVASWFGDDTARRAGRVSLNPVRHVDPFGTLILPFLMAGLGGGVLGYAKPVPIDPRRMRDPRNHAVLVALAGPATNILLALFAAVALRTWAPDTTSLGVELLFWLGIGNAFLAAFNLIPLPPLDGSAVLGRFMPRSLQPAWGKLQQYGFAILIVVVFVVPQVLSPVLDRARELWLDLL
jgi:Zn-dependent protease